MVAQTQYINESDAEMYKRTTTNEETPQPTILIANPGFRFYIVVCDIDSIDNPYNNKGQLRCGIDVDGNHILAVYGCMKRDNLGRAELARLLVLGRCGWWLSRSYDSLFFSLREAQHREVIGTEDGFFLVTPQYCKNISSAGALQLLLPRKPDPWLALFT